MKKILYLTLAAALLFAGCSEDEPAPALSVDPTAITATADAGNYPIAVTSNVAWTATKDAEWLTLNAASGTGNGTVIVNVAANPTVEPRTGTITVITGALSQAVTVTQNGIPVNFTVDPATIDATATAAEYTLAVSSNVAWTATANAEWLTLSPASGNGDGTVNVNVSGNPAMETRSAAIVFTSKGTNSTVTVMQAAQPFHAASTQTWVIGNQTWSDAIYIPECDKEEFGTSTLDPQCRSYTHPTTEELWFYYNGPFVSQNAATLCPEPWRVPTKEDFIALDIALGGTGENRTGVESEWVTSKYIDSWGGRFGGFIFSSMPFGLGEAGMYWSSSFDATKVYGLSFTAVGNVVNPQILDTGSFGLQIRCVK
jgi:uncharacterized protein (TIGR02145 family)